MTRAALERCPFCEGGGVAPVSSGLTDTNCPCLTLDYTGWLIAAGRLEYADRCEMTAQVVSARGENADGYLHLASVKREQAAHLIYGCTPGRCTGNAGEGRCIAPTCDACDALIPDTLERSSSAELTVCGRCF